MFSLSLMLQIQLVKRWKIRKLFINKEFDVSLPLNSARDEHKKHRKR
jgi:hypothetical protein